MKSIYKITVAFLLLLVSCKEKESSNNKDKPTVVTKVKSEFDKIKLTELDGTPIDLQQYQGKTLFINFWATWCGPCKMVAPVLEELATEYEGRIVIYKVDTEAEMELAGVFGIQSIPTFLFIPVDADPMMQPGAFPKKVFKEIIEDHLLNATKQMSDEG